MTQLSSSTQRIGQLGEQYAVNLLIEKGYEILDRNYRYKRFEIDIIACKDSLLVFIEVKTRNSIAFGHPEEFVSPKQKNQIIEAADQYIFDNNWSENIRYDIIQSSTTSLNLDQSVVIFGKAKSLNKIIDKPVGIDLILSYKRASNILENELKNKNFELSNTTDPGIFRTELEKNLLKKINELKKYFQNINKDENFEQSLENLAESKKTVFEFFDNVIVNEEDQSIKKNRLELIQMLCKTFDNYVNFSKIDSH